MFDRIHHAGLAVGDLGEAKRIFADALGLLVDTDRSPLPDGRHQRGADPTDILDIPIGNSEIELNLPVGERGGSSRFLQSRGGVGALHHICLRTNNVADDVAHLRAEGLQQLAPPEQIEAGPWQSVAFFHPRDCLGILLEIWPTDNPQPGPGAQGEGIFTNLHHIGVVLNDLERARHFWGDIIGLQVDTSRSPLPGGRHMDSDNVQVLDIPFGSSAIECATPQDAVSGTAKYLARYGGSAGGTMHHICLETRDVKAAAERCEAYGLQLIDRPSTDVAWVHPKSAMGVLIEIVQG